MSSKARLWSQGVTGAAAWAAVAAAVLLVILVAALLARFGHTISVLYAQVLQAPVH